MAVTITNPSNGQEIVLGNEVIFQGAADRGVVSIELIADSKYSLKKVNVVNGNWSISYKFNTAGNRQIAAKGFDAAGNFLIDAKVNIAVKSSATKLGVNEASCSAKQRLFKIANRGIWQLPGQATFFYRSGLEIDADGAANAYHPEDEGIDFLENAGDSGDWYGLVVDEDGEPVVQKSSDPFPGYFISASALEDNTKGKYDPRRYVDSAKIPYIVLPGNQLIRDTGARLGDFAAVYNGNNGKFSYAICADIGPSQKIGEGSIALAQALGHNPFVRGKVQVGIDDDVLYVVFPRSQNASKAWSSEWSVDDVNKQAEKHFINWGGMQRIQACLTELR